MGSSTAISTRLNSWDEARERKLQRSFRCRRDNRADECAAPERAANCEGLDDTCVDADEGAARAEQPGEQVVTAVAKGRGVERDDALMLVPLGRTDAR